MKLLPYILLEKCVDISALKMASTVPAVSAHLHSLFKQYCINSASFEKWVVDGHAVSSIVQQYVRLRTVNCVVQWDGSVDGSVYVLLIV